MRKFEIFRHPAFERGKINGLF